MRSIKARNVWSSAKDVSLKINGLNFIHVSSITPPKNHVEFNVELIYDISSNLIKNMHNDVQLN